MKKIIFFLVFMANVQFVNAQSGPLGLTWVEKAKKLYCSTQQRSVVKVKIKVNNPLGRVHVYAYLDGEQVYHDHTDVSIGNDIIEFEYMCRVGAGNFIRVLMHTGATGSGENSSEIEEWNPTIVNDFNPMLVIKAGNSAIGSTSPWIFHPVVTPTSSFDLIYPNAFYINPYSSTEMLKHSVSVRQNSSGITNTRVFDYDPIYGNPHYSNLDISNMFRYISFEKSGGGYRTESYTVFIQARDCQGNIVDTKSFQVMYTSNGIEVGSSTCFMCD